MLLLKDFLPYAIDFVNKNKEDIKDYAKNLKKQGGYNDFDMRLSSDVFYCQSIRSKLFNEDQDFDFLQFIANICKIERDQINDLHIANLYKQALKQANIL